MEIFSMVLSLLSGVALFLFGMSLMGDGLKQVAGNKLEAFLYKMTNTPRRCGASQRYPGRCDPVFLSNNGNGYWLCKLRYDETETGDRYHHGSQYRYQYHRMDLMSFLY